MGVGTLLAQCLEVFPSLPTTPLPSQLLRAAFRPALRSPPVPHLSSHPGSHHATSPGPCATTPNARFPTGTARHRPETKPAAADAEAGHAAPQLLR
jgi:hypothetical protein